VALFRVGHALVVNPDQVIKQNFQLSSGMRGWLGRGEPIPISKVAIKIFQA